MIRLAFRQSGLRVGLTGGIASGKSRAAEAFERAGAVVIDTDRLARDVVAPGTPGLAEVVAAFGDDVLDEAGRLDRGVLRQRVFADPSARQRLEAITHPRIREQLVAESDRLGGPYQILVVPLLVESGLVDAVDRVLVIDVAADTQVARLTARDGETTEGARRILAAQADREARLARADDVIVNEGSVAELETCVTRLDAAYRQMAREMASSRAEGSAYRQPPGLRLPDSAAP